MNQPLCRIKLLGEVNVVRDGAEQTLPASRKARALLGLLAVSKRPLRRERLCEMFWELPDDPRAALRWALSKIRAITETEDNKIITADRERVAILPDRVTVDFVTIRDRLYDEPEFIPPPELREMAEALSRPLLDGLDRAGQEDFAVWLASERADAERMRQNVLRRISRHPDVELAEAIKWCRQWTAVEAFNAEAVATLCDLLTKFGRREEADGLLADFEKRANEMGVDLPNMKRLADTAKVERLPESRPRRMLRHQNIGFCSSDDGVRIAYATVGSGKPFVKAANWLNHLELDWGSPIWGRTFAAAAKGRWFIRYDERGNGLSDWNVDDISFDSFVRDLETVVDSLNVESFPLLGISQGCAVSIAYAVRHPERVSALVLISGYATGWRIGASTEEKERREAVLTLTRHGWGTDNPAYRHIFSQTFMPDAKPEDLSWFDEFQRLTTSAENAARFQKAFGDIDVRSLLPSVKAPTIVFHSREDQRIPLDQGRELAIGIPGARFVPLESRNHILLGDEPAWRECAQLITEFLEERGL